MASPTETASWERVSRCGCKGCAVARQEGREDAAKDVEAFYTVKIVDDGFADTLEAIIAAVRGKK